MKTLSAQASRASEQRWTELIYLLELKLWRDKYGPAPTSLVLRLSDRTRQELGQEWEPLVVDWGAPGDALNPASPDVTVGSFDVTLSNAQPIGGRARFSDLIRHGLNNDPATTYDVLFADAWLRLLFRGGIAGDDLLLFRFVVEEARNVTADSLTLRMSGVELVLEHGEDCYRVSTENFPLCDPDAVNRPLPIAFGRLTHQRTLGVTAGLVDILTRDITATDPANGGTLAISDRAIVERLPPNGLVQIDEEQFYYGWKDAGAVTLNGITRGAASTTATDHAAGTTVFQVLSEYLYLVSENRGNQTINAVTAVRSDGMLVAPSSYTVDQFNNTILPGRSVVVLRFPVKPIISKQVKYEAVDTIQVEDTTTVTESINVIDNIGVADTIGVSDTIDVNDGIGVSDGIGVNDALGVGDNINFTTQPVTQTFATNNTLPDGTALPAVAGGGGNEATAPDGSLRWYNFPGLPAGGNPQNVQWTLTVRNNQTTNNVVKIYARGTAGWQVTLTMAPDTIAPNATTVYTWGVGGNAYGNVGLWASQANATSAKVTQFSCSVLRDPYMQKSGGAYRGGGVSKSGTASKTGSAWKSGKASKSGAASKTGQTTKTGTVTKTGKSTKVGTVQLVGNSSADTVLGEITVDLMGLQDDPSGTISGTPFLLLETPHDIVKCLLREVWQEKDPALYDLDDWWATRAKQLAEEYRWALMAVPSSFSEFRRMAGFQGRAELYQEGGRWAYTWREPTTSVVRFTERNLADEVVVDWSPRTELVTELDVGYDEGGTNGTRQWQQSLTLRSDLARYRYRYGLQRSRHDLAGRTLELPWVRDTTMATRLGTYWLSQWERERMRPKIRGFWDVIGLEKTDNLLIDVPVLDAYGPMRFTVRRKTYELDDGLIQLECEETDLAPLEFEILARYGIAFSFSRSTSAALRLVRAATRTLPASAWIRRSFTTSVPVLFHVGWTRNVTRNSNYRIHRRAVDGALAAARYGLTRAQARSLSVLTRLAVPRAPTLPAELVIAAGLAVSMERSALYHLFVTSSSSLAGAYRFGPAVRTQTLASMYAFIPWKSLSAQYTIRAVWDAPGVLWDTPDMKWDTA